MFKFLEFLISKSRFQTFPTRLRWHFKLLPSQRFFFIHFILKFFLFTQPVSHSVSLLHIFTYTWLCIKFFFHCILIFISQFSSVMLNIQSSVCNHFKIVVLREKTNVIAFLHRFLSFSLFFRTFLRILLFFIFTVVTNFGLIV